MKIYRNPEGNLTLLFPSLFFGSIALIAFLITRTIITKNEIFIISIASFFTCFLAYYALAKKWNFFKIEGPNILLALSLTPSVVALVSLFNFTFSFTHYKKKIEIDDQFLEYYYKSDGGIYVDKMPTGCNKFFKVYVSSNLNDFNFVFIQVDDGILGFKVLKHKIFSED